MILTYTPSDGDRQVFEFDPDHMLNQESEAIERRTDWTWVEFLQNLQKGSTLARRALLWTFLRRTHHTLRFEDVTFTQAQLILEYDRAEMQQMRDQTAAAPDVPGVDKDAILAMMDSEIAKLAGPEPGKAPAPTDAASTSSP